ncbi:hypothetical protein SQW19_11810 [Stenotrophomonas acidaminiphila]|uniref:hypothetical protein n=1 Tax=Stenotrophomonas acidaminiphila TaxID=128780 RepID=UPI002ABD2747|nr:hypothetical protein [Stenotrophomonas acidaminiphila]WPU55027.1 hypothetical protein SQW19_11810 [Stenotrophomonas acidaminiphila]
MTDFPASGPPELPRAPAAPGLSRDAAWLLTGLAGSVLAAVAISVIGMVVYPQFADTFTAFTLRGTDLPLPTRLATRFYPAIWLAPALVLLIRLCWPGKASRAIAAGVAGLLILIVGVPLALVSAYLPMIQLIPAL